jgi:hypothetical protein
MPSHAVRAGVVAAAFGVCFGLAQAQQVERPVEMLGHPNLNGIWQAVNNADWNREAHPAELPKGPSWRLGAMGAIPAGESVVRDGKIPYLPGAIAQRDENRASWPEADPEAKCFMLGVPRVTYHNFPFQIFQGEGDLQMVYPFAGTTRIINMTDHSAPPVDTYMGKSDGAWEGDTLVVTTSGSNGLAWLDRAGNYASNRLKVTERFRLLGANHLWYEATLEDPSVYSEPWTIEMPLYRMIEDEAQLLEHKCVPFAEPLMYKDLNPPED